MSWRHGQTYGQEQGDRALACPELTLREVPSRFGLNPSYVSEVRAPACTNYRQFIRPPHTLEARLGSTVRDTH
jgi:hypothetical protein